MERWVRGFAKYQSRRTCRYLALGGAAGAKAWHAGVPTVRRLPQKPTALARGETLILRRLCETVHYP